MDSITNKKNRMEMNMEELRDMELDLNALEEAAGGNTNGSIITLMQTAKLAGKTFEQFISSMFGDNLPAEKKNQLRMLWETL